MSADLSERINTAREAVRKVEMELNMRTFRLGEEMMKACELSDKITIALNNLTEAQLIAEEINRMRIGDEDISSGS